MAKGGKRPGAGRKPGKSPKTLARERGKARGLKLAEVTAERVALELGRIALADRRGIWDEDGKLKPLDQWTEDQGALLEGAEVIIKNAEAGDGHTDRVHKVHLAKKQGALEILAKHFGYLVDKHELRIGTLEDLVAGSKE